MNKIVQRCTNIDQYDIETCWFNHDEVIENENKDINEYENDENKDMIENSKIIRKLFNLMEIFAESFINI